MGKFHKIIAGFAVLLAGIPPAALAAGGLGIMPSALPDEPSRSWFVYTLNPGEGITDSVTITNSSDKTKTIVLEALDALNTAEGGYTLVDSADQNRQVGQWITLNQTTAVIPSNRSVDVQFNLAVPDGANPGQHSGGIVAYERTSAAPGAVGLQIRLGARVYVTVPGKLERNINITKADYEIKDRQLIFNVEAINDSNINLAPAVDIKLTGLFGSRTQSENENGSYLPGSKMILQKAWDRPAPRLGYYRATLTFHTWTAEEILPDGTKRTVPDLTFAKTFSFWVGGMLLLWLILGILLAWLIYRGIVFWLDRRKFAIKTITHIVRARETVMHIAEQTNVLPQQLIRFNRLTWPYALNASDKLLIPTGWLSRDELARKRQTDDFPPLWKYLISVRTSLYVPTVRVAKEAKPRRRKR